MTSPSPPVRSIRIQDDMGEVRRHLIIAMRRVCPPALADEAEDLVQRALLKLMKSQASSEGNRTVSASYLWRVAYTAVIDEIRRRNRRREETLTENSSSAIHATSQPDPERETNSRAIGEAIRECLGRMVDARRRALTLHLVGHTVPEIASLMGRQTKQADNLVYRGMADLRRCLINKGITP